MTAALDFLWGVAAAVLKPVAPRLADGWLARQMIGPPGPGSGIPW
jgi:hypothetical protein